MSIETKQTMAPVTEGMNGSDVPGDPSATQALALDGTVTEGDVAPQGDDDWYTVSLVAGQTYYFSLSGSGANPLGAGNLTLYGMDWSNTFVALASDNSGFGAPDAWLSFTVAATGTYYVSASGYAWATGHYSLAAGIMPADLIPATGDPTVTLADGVALNGVATGSNDIDRYGIAMTAGVTYELTLSGISANGLAALDRGVLRLLDAAGTYIYSVALTDDNSDHARFYYTAAATGTYMLDVGSYIDTGSSWPYPHTNGGAYSVKVSHNIGDIDAGGPVAASIGQRITGVTEGAADSDTFTYHLIGGQTYFFYLDTPSDHSLTINGVWNTDSGFNSVRSHVGYTPTVTGDYNLVVRGAPYALHESYLTYTLTSEVRGADLPANATTPQALTVGQAFHGQFDDREEVDWYAVNLVAGQTYYLSAGKMFDAYADVAAVLVDSSGTVLNTGPLYTAASTGTAYVRATNTSFYTYGAYKVEVREVHDDSGADAAHARHISVDDAVHGRVDYSDDSDWYAVDLVAGYTYSLDLLSDPNHKAATGLVLVSSDYIQQVSFDIGQFQVESHSRFQATQTGTFYIRTIGQSYVDGADYTFRVGLVDTVADNVMTDAVLTLGQAVNSTIGYQTGNSQSARGDVDWYAVELDAGQSYLFSGQGSGVTPSSPVIFLNTVDGQYINGAVSDGAGQLQYTAQISGVYYLAVQSDTLGGYTVLASASDDIFRGTATSDTLAVGETRHSTIGTSGDFDDFRVTLEAGQSYMISLTPDSGSALLGLVSLYDDSGQLASQIDGPGLHDAAFRFTAARTGTYYVSAGGFNGSTGAYGVSLASVAPQDPLDTITRHSGPADGSISVYFATAAQAFGGHTAARDWTPAEIAGLLAAGSAWSNIANVTFSQAASAAMADLVVVLDDSTLTPLALAQLPGQPQVVVLPQGATGGVAPGSTYYSLFLAATGSALGLVSPYGWTAGHEPLEGVTYASDQGSAGLNFTAYTVMATSNYNPVQATINAPAGPMALDIAIVQAQYGATIRNAGNDTYALSPYGTGSTVVAIWDTGGTDTLSAANASYGAVIDLRAATLLSSPGGGGYLSYGRYATGGFTIAHGVVIENAIGSQGGDTLTGNDANNSLDGGAGDDSLAGGLGNDLLTGGDGNDTADFSSAAAGIVIDLNLSTAQDTHEGSDTLSGIEAVTGSRFDDMVTAATSTTAFDGGDGNDTLVLDGNFGDYSIGALWYDASQIQIAGHDAVLVARNVETFRFDDRTLSREQLFNNAPTIGGDLTSEINAGGTRVITTADLNVTDKDGDAIIFTVASINFGTILVDGVSATSFTAAQLAGGHVSFRQGGVVPEGYSAGFSVDASDGLAGESNGFAQFLRFIVIDGQIVQDGETGHSLTGTAGRDALYGNGGNDTLFGGTGDRLDGGAGDDLLMAKANSGGWYDGGAGIDTLSFAGNGKAVTIDYAGTINDVGAYANIENLTGSAFADKLTGDTGNNVLDGGTGADQLIGGYGDDTYRVDNAHDVVTEVMGQGRDTVIAGVSYTLSNDVEVLVLAGSGNIDATGSYGRNFLYGNTGNNRLDGAAGPDVLAGGAGNDVYVVDNLFDVVTELSGEGQDTVMAGVDWTLGDNLEVLLLTGSADIDATGNAQANILRGNSGDNRLAGGGGKDIFRFAAGDGHDTIVDFAAGDLIDLGQPGGFQVYQSLVQDGADVVITFSANDSLRVQSAQVSSVLAALVFAGVYGGDGDDTLNGTGGSDFLNGLGGNDRLNGLGGDDTLNGGAGNDTMAGGAGNDLYFLDSGDFVVEAADEGTDTVVTAIGFNLAGTHIENITLTGSADLSLTGDGAQNILTGNSGRNLIDGRAGADIMSGQGGNDTYVVDNSIDGVAEAVGGGVDLVSASASYILGDNVENLTLTGSAQINGTGNGLANILLGNINSNVLDGGAGADTLTGGVGNDTYYLDNAGDKAIETAGQGTDSVIASFTYGLAANIERLYLAGSGNFAGTGNGLNNQITGNGGNNKLDGGLGADTLIGGLGNDSYYIDDLGDRVAEAAGEGLDQVYAAITFTLGSNVENLQLVGSADLNGTGNGLNNVIWGTGGNNRLDGGAGADKLLGGLGDDTYIVDNVADQATDVTGGGIDTVLASQSHILGQYVENLVLTGSANITATGNVLDNVLLGNAGNNRLTGGAGQDEMDGGAGHDTYYVDNAGDTVVELANHGIDLVQSTVSFTLSANVENLFLNGSGNLNGTGNALNNLITGTSGNNVLDGAGGVDKLFGGQGNDTYYLDNASDSAKDEVNGGIDIVYSSASCVLTPYIEDLTLTGSANITGTGNALANILVGNSGNNKLDGGTGNDSLTGGLGADIFVFGVNSGIDAIGDFSALQGDYINLKAYSHGVAYGGGVTITQTGADVLIDLGGGNSVTVLDTLKADLSGHIFW